jgi:hypothetical protein
MDEKINGSKKGSPCNLKEKIYEHFFKVYYPNHSKKCLKTHYQAYFFEPFLEEIVEKYDIFCMVRDPRDVMVASYHYYNNTNFERFIKESDFFQFLRKELWDVQAETQPFSYSRVKPRNIVDKWSNHVLSWLPYKDKGATFIRFYDLKTHFEQTPQYIVSRSQQRLKEIIQPVTVEDKRYRTDLKKPGLERGSVGSWIEYFTKDDLRFLEDIIPEKIRKITYPAND